MSLTPRLRLYTAAVTAAVLVSAVALVAGSVPVQAARAPVAAPAALDTCQNPTNAFVSLEVAPEVTGTVPVGAGYHRLWDMAVTWRDINPAPGVWNWTVLDQRVAQAEASGAIPMLVLGMTPQWAASDPNATSNLPQWGQGSISPPAEMATFEAYVDKVMSQYGHRIGAYEVWNEANLTTFWKGTAGQMAEMTKIVYDKIQAKGFGAKLIAASVTTRLRGPMKSFVTAYAQALKTLGFPLDAWAIHTYPAGNAGPPERKADIKNWQQVLAEALGAGSPGLDKQVWDTEVNYGLAGPGDTVHTDYSDAQGADLVTQTFADSLELGIDATFWYLYTAAPFSLLGVQFWSGTPLTTAAWAAARSKYGAGANLCTGASTGATPTPTPTTTTPKSITIAATCIAVKVGKQQRLTVSGSSTGLAGAQLVIYMKWSTKNGFVNVSWKKVSARSLYVTADGSITFAAAQKSPTCGKVAGREFKVKAEADDVTSNVVTTKTT